MASQTPPPFPKACIMLERTKTHLHSFVWSNKNIEKSASSKNLLASSVANSVFSAWASHPPSEIPGSVTGYCQSLEKVYYSSVPCTQSVTYTTVVQAAVLMQFTQPLGEYLRCISMASAILVSLIRDNRSEFNQFLVLIRDGLRENSLVQLIILICFEGIIKHFWLQLTN